MEASISIYNGGHLMWGIIYKNEGEGKRKGFCRSQKGDCHTQSSETVTSLGWSLWACACCCVPGEVFISCFWCGEEVQPWAGLAALSRCFFFPVPAVCTPILFLIKGTATKCHPVGARSRIFLSPHLPVFTLVDTNSKTSGKGVWEMVCRILDPMCRAECRRSLRAVA